MVLQHIPMDNQSIRASGNAVNARNVWIPGGLRW
jgi:hypothetical protein